MGKNRIDKHGLKMVNLAEIANITKGMHDESYLNDWTLDIAYDPKTGIIHNNQIVGQGYTVWSEELIDCGNLDHPTFQYEIANIIYKHYEKEHGKI